MANITAANSKLQAAMLSGEVQLLPLPQCLMQKLSQLQVTGSPPGGASCDSPPSTNGDEHKGAAVTGGSQWGLQPLIQQLQAAAASQDMAEPAKSGAPSAAGSATFLLEAAAAVAMSLVQQLDVDPWQLPPTTDLSVLPGQAAVDEEAAQQQQPKLKLSPAYAPAMHLQRLWMAAVSPRLRVKGVAGGGGGPRAAAAGVSTSPFEFPTDLSVPRELLSVWQSLQAGIAFCLRNSSTGSSGSSSKKAVHTQHMDPSEEGPTAGDHHLWFSLMDVYVEKLRDTQVEQLSGSWRQQQPGEQRMPAAHQQQQWQRPSQAGSSADGSSADAAGGQREALGAALGAARQGQLQFQELPRVLCSGAAAVAAAALHELFGLLCDELVRDMADHVPLLAIVRRVLQVSQQQHLAEATAPELVVELVRLCQLPVVLCVRPAEGNQRTCSEHRAASIRMSVVHCLLGLEIDRRR
jgi:hypothetical protein